MQVRASSQAQREHLVGVTVERGEGEFYRQEAISKGFELWLGLVKTGKRGGKLKV